jgi:hypothetical protein
LFVFGEHAEQALDEEVGDFCSPSSARRAAHGGGELGELAGGFGGDLAAVDFSGRSFSGSVNTHLRICRASGVDQLVDADFARLVRVAGEGGVDDDAFAVADDEQRRVVELQA